jgi:hypothetical protein
MGTNYYLRPKGACATQCSNWPHLGKSSVGWDFSFRAYPDADPPVTGFASWKRQLEQGEVYDEYGRLQDTTEFLAFVESKRGGLSELHRSDYHDEAGNRFTPEEFS